jgi:ribosome maturation factor RimP
MDKLAQLKDVITQEITRHFEGTDLFLVEVNVLPNGKIEIFADGTVNITIDQCAAISRHIEHYLESNGYVGEKYTLEVSSPGMDQPLKTARQYQKHTGKDVDVVLKNGNKITGTLLAFDEEKITLQVIEEKKKKKKTDTEETADAPQDFSFEAIKSVKKHFNFKL